MLVLVLVWVDVADLCGCTVLKRRTIEIVGDRKGASCLVVE